MLRLILMRLIQVPLVILAMSLLVFVFLNASGDPVLLLLPFDASPEDVEEMRKALGLDKPLMVRYGIFLWDAIHGDFGVSLRSHQPALSIVLDALPATIELALAAMLVATVISIPLGITAAVKRGGTIDMTATVVSVLGQSMPVFWLGILLIMLFSVTLHWFPVSGRGGISSLILPAVTLGWYMNALMTRMTRTAMLEVLSEPYIITARAKGLPERLVIMKHAFRNARVPIITIWGLQAGTMLTGTVVTETVFSWPGIGLLAVQAVQARDYMVVQAVVVFIAGIFIIANLFVDILYAYLDPRIRYN